MLLAPLFVFVEQLKTSPLLHYVPRSSFVVISQAPPIKRVTMSYNVVPRVCENVM